MSQREHLLQLVRITLALVLAPASTWFACKLYQAAYPHVSCCSFSFEACEDWLDDAFQACLKTYSLYKADGTLVKEAYYWCRRYLTSGDVLTKTELTTLVQNTCWATADLLTKGIYQDKISSIWRQAIITWLRLHLQRDMNSMQIRFQVAPATFNAADQTIVPTVAKADKPITPPTPTPDPNPEPKPKTPKKKRSNLPDTGDECPLQAQFCCCRLLLPVCILCKGSPLVFDV